MPVQAETARRLERLLAAEQVAARAPSLVAGVVRRGELCWSGTRGRFADLAGDRRPTVEQTQYRIGSITKTMTTALVLQLRDEGCLSLEDRLGTHLSGVNFADRTVRELLTHASGLPAEPPGPWWERSPGIDFDELSRRIASTSPVLPRGQQYHYSNLAFGLLGRLVGELRGTSWRAALHHCLLEPLGMATTTYNPGDEAAQGFSVHPWSGTLVPEPHQDTHAMAAAGQLWSTVPDLGRFAAFLADPDEGVLSKSSVEEMCVPRSGTPDAGLTVTYGLGTRLLLTPDGRGLVGHTGSMPGFLAGLFVDRDRRTGAVCLANVTAGMRCEGLPADMLRELAAAEPAAPEEWVPTAQLPATVEEILGVWYWGATPLELRWDRDRLALGAGDAARVMHYRPAGADGFLGVSGYHTGERLQVVRRADGSVSHLECATFVYTREPYQAGTPIPGGHPGH
jgi:CubicO group peptidase (beta-lactamase class C family)